MTHILLARILGNVLGGAFLFGIGYAVAAGMQKRRGGNLPRWPLIIGGLVAVLSITLSVTKTLYASQQSAPLKPMVVRQSALGMTDADLTREYAQEVQNFLVRDISGKLPQGSGKVGAGSVTVIPIGDRRLGIVRITTNGVPSLITVFGIRDGNLVRVTCVNEVGEADYRAPDCASTIKHALDVQLP